MLSLYLLHGVHSTYGYYTGKQILLAVLEVSYSIFYYFGVNAIHICYGSIFTTNDMVMAEYSLMLMTALFYAYGFVELFLGSKCGKHIFS